MESSRQKFYSTTLLVLAIGLLTFGVQRFLPVRPARAATFTICASGCDYTTLTAANNANPGGNTTFLIQASYDPSTETYPTSLNNTNNIYDCQNSGAVIGIASGGQRLIAIGNGNIIRNCTVTNMRINLSSSNQVISDNIFITSTAVSMFLSSVQNFTISNNNGINDVYINGATGNGTFSGNTFDLNSAGWSPNIPILFGANVTNTVFANNTFHGNLAAFTTFITGFGTDLTFASNTFDFSVNPTGAGVKHTILDLSGARITVQGNKMSFPTADAGTQFMGVYLSPTNAAVSTTATVINNTMKIPVGLNGSSGGPVGVWAGSTAAFPTTVTSSYNIIASTSTNPNSIGILLSKAAAALTLNNDYNDFYNINTNLSLVGGASGSLGANTRTTDPYFRIKDASSVNDFYLAPFSTFLNVNNTFIGADNGPRRTTIYVDPNGTIDYSTIDATSTNDAINNLMSGDTIQLAAGTYSAFTISSTTLATSSITITGSGATTIINGTGSANALTLQGLDSCALNTLLVQNAGATFAGIKFATTTNCTLTSVTSTGNGYGVWFSGLSTGNSLNESAISLSTNFDVLSGVAGTNTLKNVAFTVASTSLGVSSTIQSYFKARALVQDESNNPVLGALVSLSDSRASTTTLSSDGTGYTSFSSYLIASVLTNGNSTITSGGYNPYTIAVAATSSKAASSTSQNLSAVNQTFTITLFASSTPTSSDPAIITTGGGSVILTPNIRVATTTITTTPNIVTSTDPVVTTTPELVTTTPDVVEEPVDTSSCKIAPCIDTTTPRTPPKKVIKPVDVTPPELTTTSLPVVAETITTPPTPTAPITDTLVPTTTIVISTHNVLATKIYALTKRSLQSFTSFIQSPAVQDKAARTVTPAVVVATAAATAAFITWADILPLLRYLFLQPALLLGQRKRRGWGQVYNALNKLPVDLATVRLLDDATGKIISTRVTDGLGRYAFIAQPGTYRILVTKNALTFPSALMSGFIEDGRRTDIYHGETITVNEKDAVITANIPLDPIGEARLPRRLLIQQILRTAQIFFSSAGFAITLTSTVIAPRWYMFVLLALHTVLLIVFRRLAVPPKVKSWGIVYDKDNRTPIGRAIVRLYNQQFNKLVDTQITDARGRYYFMAADNKYFVSYDHPSYNPEHTSTLDLSGHDTDTIAVDMGLAKKSESPPATSLKN